MADLRMRQAVLQALDDALAEDASVILLGEDIAEAGGAFKCTDGLLEKYGTTFRTFKHGAFHGTLAALFISLPIIGTNALFERKSFKYVAINVGYWMLTMALMGGVVCAFL